MEHLHTFLILAPDGSGQSLSPSSYFIPGEKGPVSISQKGGLASMSAWTWWWQEKFLPILVTEHWSKSSELTSSHLPEWTAHVHDKIQLFICYLSELLQVLFIITSSHKKTTLWSNTTFLTDYYIYHLLRCDIISTVKTYCQFGRFTPSTLYWTTHHDMLVENTLISPCVALVVHVLLLLIHQIHASTDI